MDQLTKPKKIAGQPHGYPKFGVLQNKKTGGGNNLEIKNLADQKDLRLSDERLATKSRLYPTQIVSTHPPSASVAFALR
jgi:hypothetical protein